MNEIRCPKCGEVFCVDESGYAAIVKQVRDSEFKKEIQRREAELNSERDTKLKLSEAEAEKKHTAEMAEKESELQSLRAQLAAAEDKKALAVSEALAEKGKEAAEQAETIAKLKADLEVQKAAQAQAITEAIADKDRTISKLQEEAIILNGKILSGEQSAQLKEQTLKESYETKLRAKDDEVAYYRDINNHRPIL